MELVTKAEAFLSTPAGPLELRACWGYFLDTPMEVTLTLLVDIDLPHGGTAEQATSWVFARDLLDTAFSQPEMRVGMGDVRVTYLPTQSHVKVELLDDKDTFHPVYLDSRPTQDWLVRSLRLVPAHKEHVDVDAAIAQCFEKP